MNHCLRLLLVLFPALIAFGLLGIASSTYWWMIPVEKNIPQANSITVSNDAQVYSMSLPITISYGLLRECIEYRSIQILVSNSLRFRKEMSSEDQLKLSNENCSYSQFRCQAGTAISRSSLTKCIDQSEQCNGIIDCEDKSDEVSCIEHYSTLDCRMGYTKCLDGKSCYRKDEQSCDGFSNCMDNSDEKDCDEKKCNLNKHAYCSQNKKCARRENSFRCDGIVDCEDSSDEEGCDKCIGDTNAFLCDAKCFLPKHRCDNIVHCSDFRDELNCANQTGTTYLQRNLYYKDRLCEVKRFNPFNMHPPTLNISLSESYPSPNQCVMHHNLMYYLKLIVFYGITTGLMCIFMSIMSLLFFACCRYKCRSAPFYFYGFWTLLAWLLICIALLSFVYIWLCKEAVLLDYEKYTDGELMIHQRKPMLRNLEFFGLSFWLACGAALATFLGLLLSCCMCCTSSSSRSENKEYEIMHMQSY